ncbi:glycosyltransferase family 39 protein, partial [Elstera cyanobacteriorum]|uniref:glycosyltransferase family 39 protein n=1 Tax=Elstera cyanobacteriorum TaxID=2022747 RepID=UPI0023F50998
PLRYLALGLAVGLGVLAKYSYAVFATALLLALLAAPDTRALLATRWTAAALALALHRSPHDAQRVGMVRHLAALTGLAVLAVGDVRMHARSRKPLLDVLEATRLNCRVAEAGAALKPNAEAHLRSRLRLGLLYPPEWLAASVAWAERCTFSLDELSYQYPREIVPQGHTPAGPPPSTATSASATTGIFRAGSSSVAPAGALGRKSGSGMGGRSVLGVCKALVVSSPVWIFRYRILHRPVGSLLWIRPT